MFIKNTLKNVSYLKDISVESLNQLIYSLKTKNYTNNIRIVNEGM